jgi:hypothetical protein
MILKRLSNQSFIQKLLNHQIRANLSESTANQWQISGESGRIVFFNSNGSKLVVAN